MGTETELKNEGNKKIEKNSDSKNKATTKSKKMEGKIIQEKEIVVDPKNCNDNDDNSNDIEIDDEIMKHLKEIEEEIDEEEKNNEEIEKNQNDYYNENDKEFMKMFRSKIKLDDGTEEYIFSSGVRYSRLLSNNRILYSKSFFPINCHLCKDCRIKGKFSLRAHIESREHKRLLERSPPNAKEYRKAFIQPYGIKFIRTPIKIYPGENIKRITPEYYDRMLPIKDCNFKPLPSRRLFEELKDDPIQDYNRNAPILGLCYAFKMKLNAHKIVYYCTLCDTEIHGEAYQHFVGAGHQADYILRHFKQLHCHISETLEAKVSNSLKRRRAVRAIFRVLYRKIEKVRGLRKISIIDAKDFKRSQKKFVYACRNPLIQYHYDENTIGFPDNEIKELIDKAIKGEHIIDDDPISLKDRRQRSISPISKRSSITSIRNTSNDNRNPSKYSNLSNIHTEIRKRSDPPEPQLDDSPMAWDRYRRMLGATLDDLDEKYEKYEENPENHPKYETKWKSFWRHRVRELEKDYIDPEKYDFKPEWEKHWSGLLKKFYERDVGRCKYDIKKSLKLSLHKRSPSPIRRRISRLKLLSDLRSRSRSRKLYKSRTPSLSSERNDNYKKRIRLESPIEKRDRHNQYHEQRRQDQDQEHHYRHHSKSHYDDKRNYEYDGRHQQEKKEEKGYSNKNRKRTHSQSPSLSQLRAIERTEPASVVSVLRLLTALEDQLGSLGPKAIEFLGKAILFEKENNRNSNELLKDSEYYMFFMTSMEKLKGQIFANIVPPHKLRPVKNVIDDMEKMIHNFDEYKRKNHVIFGTGNQFSSSGGTQIQTNSYRGNDDGSMNHQQMQQQPQPLIPDLGRHYENENYRNASNAIGNSGGNGHGENIFMSGLQDASYNQQIQRFTSSGGGGEERVNYLSEGVQYNKDLRANIYNRGNNDGNEAGGYMRNTSQNNRSGDSGEMNNPRIQNDMRSSSGYFGSEGFNSFRNSSNNVLLSPLATSSPRPSGKVTVSQSANTFGNSRNQLKPSKLTNTFSNNSNNNNNGLWQRGNNLSSNNQVKDNYSGPSSSKPNNPFRKNMSGRKEMNMMESGNSSNVNALEDLVCPSPPSFSGYIDHSNY